MGSWATGPRPGAPCIWGGTGCSWTAGNRDTTCWSAADQRAGNAFPAGEGRSLRGQPLAYPGDPGLPGTTTSGRPTLSLLFGKCRTQATAQGERSRPPSPTPRGKRNETRVPNPAQQVLWALARFRKRGGGDELGKGARVFRGRISHVGASPSLVSSPTANPEVGEQE